MVRSDDLRGMMAARGEVLCHEIAEATGRPVGGPGIAELVNSERPSEDEGDEEGAPDLAA
jgi:hypothetical protein